VARWEFWIFEEESTNDRQRIDKESTRIDKKKTIDRFYTIQSTEQGQRQRQKISSLKKKRIILQRQRPISFFALLRKLYIYLLRRKKKKREIKKKIFYLFAPLRCSAGKRRARKQILLIRAKKEPEKQKKIY
jgi:hypothetical protein